MYTLSITRGQPFDIDANNVYNSVSGSWSTIGDAVPNGVVKIRGIYWSESALNAELKIRDTHNVVWYHAICAGDAPVVDLLPNSLPLYTPFEYFDSVGNNIIIIYGEYN